MRKDIKLGTSITDVMDHSGRYIQSVSPDFYQEIKDFIAHKEVDYQERFKKEKITKYKTLLDENLS